MSKKSGSTANKKPPSRVRAPVSKASTKATLKTKMPSNRLISKKSAPKKVSKAVAKKAPVYKSVTKPAVHVPIKTATKPKAVVVPVRSAPKATEKEPSRKIEVKPAPKAIASSAKRSPPVKVKRPSSSTNGVEFAGELTDDDIRAMPESDYMNDIQFEFFRQRLIKMREEVLARELDVKERLHQREVFADPADRATAEEEHWLDLRLRERESMLMRKIEDALRRIRDKDYGYCVKTGEAIGIPRLLARPTATVIVDVKDQDERVETHFRDR